MLSEGSRTDQLFRTAVLLSPYRKAAHTEILDFDNPCQDDAAERCARHVEAYVIQQQEDEEESTTISEALEEVADLAGELWRNLKETLETWCDLCDQAQERDRGNAICTASMLALESPYVRGFAVDVGLPEGDTAGRLSRLHNLFCPQWPHQHIPQLILATLPNLGFFL